MNADTPKIDVDAAAVLQLARSKRQRRRIATAALLLVIGGVIGASTSWVTMRYWGSLQGQAAASEGKTLYQCPMHPTITADHPGDCPICGMKLVQVKQRKAAGSVAGAKPLYQCPMHPAITGDHEGDCPICGMKLVEAKAAPGTASSGERKVLFYRSPVDSNQTSHTPRKDEIGMDYVPVYEDEMNGGGSAVEGLVTVTIDPARQQLIGLRTAPVSTGPVAGSWRTVGRVQVDPTRVRKTNIKVEGYVERLYVDFVGRPVRRGQPLFSLYSPSLLAAENEYVLALKTRDDLKAAGATGDDGTALVEAARRKLELWDLPEAEIQQLEKTRRPSRTRTFLSPINGVVTAKNVVQGARVNSGDTPYEITDLSAVWVMVDAYESDLGHVRVGMPATLRLKTYPDRNFSGKVAFIDPLLDPATRTAKVHLHFPNPTGELKPEMYGETVLEGHARHGLRIPSDAVIRSGTKDVVFIALADGKFLPREVRLGVRSGNEVQVTSGLEAGQQVVSRANFLVDSESQLRASLAAMTEKQP